MVELVATVTVAAILTTIAVPAVTSTVKTKRTWTEANSLVLALNYARSEGIKRDLVNGVSVCTTIDNSNCSPNGWQNGWIVRVNDPVTPVVLLQAIGVSANNTITEAAGLTELRFQANGSVVFVGNGALANAAFKVCDSTNDPRFARDVEVSLTGRIVSGRNAGLNVQGGAMVCP
jgi:type IV fimbrial biogenesis protein FimT